MNWKQWIANALIIVGFIALAGCAAYYWSWPVNPFSSSIYPSGDSLYVETKSAYDWGMIRRVTDLQGHELPAQASEIDSLHFLTRDYTHGGNTFRLLRLVAIPGFLDSTACASDSGRAAGRLKDSNTLKRLHQRLRAGELTAQVRIGGRDCLIEYTPRSAGSLLFRSAAASPPYISRAPGVEDGDRTLYASIFIHDPICHQLAALVYLFLAVFVLRNQVRAWKQVFALTLVVGLVFVHIPGFMWVVPAWNLFISNYFNHIQQVIYGALAFMLLYLPRPRPRKFGHLIGLGMLALWITAPNMGLLFIWILSIVRIFSERRMHRMFYRRLTRLAFGTALLMMGPLLVSRILIQITDQGGLSWLAKSPHWSELQAVVYGLNSMGTIYSDLITFIPFGFMLKAAQFDITRILKGFRYLWLLSVIVFIALVIDFTLVFLGQPTELSILLGYLAAWVIVRDILGRRVSQIPANSLRRRAEFSDESFKYLSIPDYAEVFVQRLRQLYPRIAVSLSLPEEQFGAGLSLSPTLSEAAGPVNGFNLDLERLNETPLGESLPVKPDPNTPSLILPIRNKDLELGFLLLGPHKKSWWDADNEEYVRSLLAIFTRFYLNLRQHNEHQETQLQLLRETEESRRQRELAEVLADYNKRISDSIHYAAYIQRSILPHAEEIARHIPNSFVLWSQRDIVGGDFYWVQPIKGGVMLAAADCTGHGVPGALLTMSANSLLNAIVREKGVMEPAEVLRLLHEGITETLRQHADREQQDGMDIALVRLRPGEAVFAGARLPLRLIRRNDAGEPELLVFKGARFSLGGVKGDKIREFTQKTITLHSGDRLYLATDGIVDQPIKDGDKVLRLGSRRFGEWVLEMQSLPIGNQYEWLLNRLNTGTEGIEQRDDITVAAVEG
jgi:serine phosphatase RsbU (regulator of sigma subunit)